MFIKVTFTQSGLYMKYIKVTLFTIEIQLHFYNGPTPQQNVIPDQTTPRRSLQKAIEFRIINC